MTVLGAAFIAIIVSWLICAAIKANARQWQLVDVPNVRSSHVTPTPRGGGIGIVCGFCAALVAAVVMGDVGLAALLPLLPALPIAVLGFIDDRKSLGVRLRLFVQLTCAAAIVALVAPTFSAGLPALLVAVAMVVYAAWLINLYNFMDGIDGIAATQAITVLAGAMVISWLRQGDAGNQAWLLLMAASAGFLWWNWAPARLFMGDSGSTFLGAVLAAWSLGTDSVPLASWLILMAAFIGDASFTLLRRAWRREAVWQAHRSHLYQRLSRRWNSHARVCLAFILVNVVWLLPLAALAAWCGQAGMPLAQYALVVAAYLPILFVAYTMA